MGYNCEFQCDATADAGISVSVVMDVSGTLASNPNKDQFVQDFFTDLLGPMDTSTQAEVGITSFSDTATVDLPMGHYDTLQVWDAVGNVDWVGGNTNITGGVQTAAAGMDTTDDKQDVMIIIRQVLKIMFSSITPLVIVAVSLTYLSAIELILIYETI